VTVPLSSAKAIWDEAQISAAAERKRIFRDMEASCNSAQFEVALFHIVANRFECESRNLLSAAFAAKGKTTAA
jgi:hypothetical protein